MLFACIVVHQHMLIGGAGLIQTGGVPWLYGIDYVENLGYTEPNQVNQQQQQQQQQITRL